MCAGCMSWVKRRFDPLALNWYRHHNDWASLSLVPAGLSAGGEA